MDLNKAQRLLHKIQAFLDNGNGQELSRLEKDLIKSYIVQLYDAIQFEDASHSTEHVKPVEIHEPKKHFEPPVYKSEIQPTKPVEFHKPEPPKQEVKTETARPTYQDYSPPVHKEEPVKKEPAPQLKWEEPEVKVQPRETPDPVKEYEPVTKHQPVANDQEAILKLFEQKSDDISNRYGFVPIASIESAMGLNERIFTLNELFGGDKALFDSTCARLNQLNSFNEAKELLLSGPVKDYKWGDPERIKMAEQFIRIVSRKYPRAGS